MFLQTMKTKIFALNRLTRLSGYVTGTVIYSSSTLGLKLFAKKGTGTWCMDCQSLEHMVHSAKDQCFTTLFLTRPLLYTFDQSVIDLEKREKISFNRLLHICESFYDSSKCLSKNNLTQPPKNMRYDRLYDAL